MEMPWANLQIGICGHAGTTPWVILMAVDQSRCSLISGWLRQLKSNMAKELVIRGATRQDLKLTDTFAKVGEVWGHLVNLVKLATSFINGVRGRGV